MNVAISPRTEKLLSDCMRDGNYSSPDEAIQIALEAFEPGLYEGLDFDTRAAIERADEQGERGKGISVNAAFSHLRRNHVGDGHDDIR